MSRGWRIGVSYDNIGCVNYFAQVVEWRDMMEYCFAFLTTVAVSIMITLLDSHIGSHIIERHRNYLTESIIDSSLTDAVKRQKISKIFEQFRLVKICYFFSGLELAVVSISLDFTALLIWINDPTIFPFFSRFNIENVSRENLVWFLFIFMDLFFLICAISFKHFHVQYLLSSNSQIEKDTSLSPVFYQTCWKTFSLIIGFISLLTSILVFSNVK